MHEIGSHSLASTCLVPEPCKDVSSVTDSTLSALVGLGWHWWEQEVELKAVHATIALHLQTAMDHSLHAGKFWQTFPLHFEFSQGRGESFLKCYGFGVGKSKLRLEWWQGGDVL